MEEEKLGLRKKLSSLWGKKPSVSAEEENKFLENLRETFDLNYQTCQRAIIDKFNKDVLTRNLKGEDLQNNLRKEYEVFNKQIEANFLPLELIVKEFLHSQRSEIIERELEKINAQKTSLHYSNFLSHGIQGIYYGYQDGVDYSYWLPEDTKQLLPSDLLSFAKNYKADLDGNFKAYEKVWGALHLLKEVGKDELRQLEQSFQETNQKWRQFDESCLKIQTLNYESEKADLEAKVCCAAGRIQAVLDNLPELKSDGPQRLVQKTDALRKYQRWGKVVDCNLYFLSSQIEKGLQQIAELKKEAAAVGLNYDCREKRREIEAVWGEANKIVDEFSLYRDLADRAIAEYFLKDSRFGTIPRRPFSDLEYSLLLKLEKRFGGTGVGVAKIGRHLNLGEKSTEVQREGPVR